jgi:EAL domain-containing protein (putative c-di-GMP-specific phosphodiesterase class I)
MDVVAEGIETESQLQLFRELGCEFAQGFYFSRGLDIPSARALVEKSAAGNISVFPI